MSETGGPAESEVVEQASFLSLLAGAPWIGAWVCLGLLAIPMLGVVLLSFLVPGLSDAMQSEGESISRLMSFVLFIVAVLTVPWLRFLERRAGLRLTFYWIPCVWIAWVMIFAFAAGVVFGPSMWEG